MTDHQPPRQYRVAIDFDGTIAEHEFPDIGPEVPRAFYWMLRWQQAGAMLILWTMRSADRQKYGDVLAPAVQYCQRRGVTFDGVNEGPQDRTWTTSPKAYAHTYVDDAAFGCPLVRPCGRRPYVDWDIVGPYVLQQIEAYNNQPRWNPGVATP